MGAGLQYIDVGGGLGVDYDGSGTNFASSMNYTLNEYASDVVYRIASVCNARDIAAPDDRQRIRARHRRPPQRADLRRARLLGARSSSRSPADRGLDYTGARKLPQPVLDLFDAYRTVNERRLVECYHDALHGPRAGAADVQPGPAVAGVPRPGRAALLGHLRQDPRPVPQARAAARGTGGPGGDPLRHLLLQLLGVPVAAGQLGHRPAVPDHAHPPPRRAADAQRRAGRHHLRLRRQDRPLRQPARRQAHARGARAAPGRATTTWPRSWSAPTRRPSATCTTCSATRMWCTSACTTRAAGGSRRSSRATRPTRCSSTWSTTWPSCTRPWRATASARSATAA